MYTVGHSKMYDEQITWAGDIYVWVFHELFPEGMLMFQAG